MISLFTKYWRLILDVILVIALITFIFLWNPFNLFGKRLKLQHTTNMVTEVKAIGQLITAEYYGEVVASIDEAKLNLLSEDFLNDRANYLYRQLKLDIYNSYQQHVLQKIAQEKKSKRKAKIRRKGKKDALKEIIENYGSEYGYAGQQLEIFKADTLDLVLLYTIEKLITPPSSVNLNRYEKGKRKQFRKKQLENLYDYIEKKQLALSEDDFNEYLASGFDGLSEFTSFYYNNSTPETTKKRQLAMIGRGSVKAGFDFSNLKNHQFQFDDNRNTLHLFGIKPMVLNADINPWFIPERAVPGFDIVQAGKKATFEDAVKVKSYCREKLMTYALQAGILEEAKRYGESLIQSFFSILLDTEIDRVVFHENLEEVYFQQITRDSLIRYSEIPLIFSAEKEYLQNIENAGSEALQNAYELQLQTLITKLHSFPLLLNDSSLVSFNYFTCNMHHLLSDSILSNTSLSAYQTTILKHRWATNDSTYYPSQVEKLSYWFVDSSTMRVDKKLFASYFNTTLSLIKVNDSLKSHLDIESFKYPCILNSKDEAFFIKTDSLRPEQFYLKMCLPPHEALQQQDYQNYLNYLQKLRSDYISKTWVYKWRDQVSESINLDSLQYSLREKARLKH